MKIAKYFKYLLYVPLFVALLSYIFPKYINYCKECGQYCSLMTNKSLKQCVRECYCPSIAPRISAHVDNKKIFDLDKDLCPIGYAPTPELQQVEKVTPPNIILFVLDDLDELITPYFEAMTFSKKLFKLNGTHFENGFTSTSYCCPARCQILSGMYGHNNGNIGMYGKFGTINAFRRPHYLNGTRMKEHGKCVNNEFRSINQLLRQNGNYFTSIFGKYLNGIENQTTRNIDYMPVGWDEFHVGADPYMYAGYRYTLTNYSSDYQNDGIKYEWFNVEPEDYITDVLAKKVVNMLETQRVTKNNKKPIFSYIAPSAPHLPLPCAERHRDKIQYWRSQYDKYVTTRPNYDFVHNSRADSFLNNPRRSQIDKEGDEWNRLDWEKRLTSLYAVDEMIEKIYNKIKELGELDNTIFALVSDNGYNLGAHGIFNKMTPYDESVKIPFYISGPHFNKNVTLNELVLLNDLAPTFLSLAGLSHPDTINGKSLIPNRFNKKRESVLIQFKSNDEYVPEDLIDVNPEIAFIRHQVPKWLLFDFHPYVAIRTNNFLYVEHKINNSTMEYELFDLTNDPHQMYNVYNNETYSKNKVYLKYKMDQLSKCHGKKCIG